MTTEGALNWYQSNRKNKLQASAIYHAPMDTITRVMYHVFSGFSTFDAIPTGWVSKHRSVGLILLQYRISNAVDA
jgi:hypothetical protein